MQRWQRWRATNQAFVLVCEKTLLLQNFQKKSHWLLIFGDLPWFPDKCPIGSDPVVGLGPRRRPSLLGHYARRPPRASTSTGLTQTLTRSHGKTSALKTSWPPPSSRSTPGSSSKRCRVRTSTWRTSSAQASRLPFGSSQKWGWRWQCRNLTSLSLVGFFYYGSLWGSNRGIIMASPF